MKIGGLNVYGSEAVHVPKVCFERFMFFFLGIALKQRTVWCLICFANKKTPDDNSDLSTRTLFKLKFYSKQFTTRFFL